jgi:hypothetical protein
MSDLRKWMKIVESIPGIFPDAPTKPVVVKKDATVMVHPRLGGGTGRYMHSTPNGAMIDIKGVARELTYEDFSVPERDYEDGYEKGNDWFHMTIEPETPGRQNDKPEFRPGDIVKVADVYGTVIGPGMGIFIAYSTSGQEGIVSFDNKEIVVPIANVGAAYEQDAKDQFNQMDNDGNLSTLSFGSDNVKVDVPGTGMSVKEPEMDHRDEFSKWIATVEEALTSEGTQELAEVVPDHEQCGCGNWDCQVCFPDPAQQPAQAHPGIEFSGGPDHSIEPQVMDFGANEPMGPVVGQEEGVCPTCGHECTGHGEEPQQGTPTLRDLMNMIAGLSGGGAAPAASAPAVAPVAPVAPVEPEYELGADEVEHEIPYNDIDKDFEYDESGSAGGMGAGGMAQRMEDAMEEEPMEEEPEHFVEKPKSGRGVKLGDITQVTQFKPTGGDCSPLSQDGDNLGATPVDEMGEDIGGRDAFDIPEEGWYDPGMEDVHDPETVQMVDSIMSMQDSGLSNADQRFERDQLLKMSPEQIKKIRNVVMGKTRGGVEEMMTQYTMGESETYDQHQAEQDSPVLYESNDVRIDPPSLMMRLDWDRELREAFIVESTLSRIIGKEKGGQKLVQWMHRRHRLSNEADLQPAPFNQRMLWKEFKSNPDNFIIVAASGGVAGIKPYKEYIEKRAKEFSRKGKTYHPGGDSTLPYQVIAFTDDGQQVDPELLKPKKEPGEEDQPDYEKYTDPTVMKARMGLHHGRDFQNPDNVFNLLADQIGELQTVFVTKGAVEREKMAKRGEVEKPIESREAMKKIFDRIRPVLKKIGDQAMGQINRTAQRYITGGNFEAAQKIAKTGQKLKQFLVTLDKSGDIAIDTNWGSSTKDFSEIIQNALVKASGSRMGTPEYNEWLNNAVKGNSVALKPILDALRDNLVELQ